MSKSGPRPLYTVDLAGLLRIAEKNWRDLAEAWGFCGRAFCVIKHLQQARNEFAHRAAAKNTDPLFDEYDKLACDILIQLLDSAVEVQVA